MNPLWGFNSWKSNDSSSLIQTRVLIVFAVPTRNVPTCRVIVAQLKTKSTLTVVNLVCSEQDDTKTRLLLPL